MSPSRICWGNTASYSQVLKNKGILKAVAVSVILYITNLVSTNFFSLYVTQRLGLSDQLPCAVPDPQRGGDADLHGRNPAPLNTVKFRIPLWFGLILYALRGNRC